MPRHIANSNPLVPEQQTPGQTAQRTATAPARFPAASRIRDALPPTLAVYAGAATLHLAVLAYMIPSGGPSLTNRLTAWDGQAYIQIAAHGYPHGFTYTPDGQLTGNNLAFFPLYPLLIRTVHTVTGTDWPAAAILTSQLAAVTALVLVHQLMRRLYTQRAATIVIVLLAAAQPMSIAFFMAYSESLFLALAAATLLAAHCRAWLTAALCALATGLTRPAGAAVIVALAVAVLLDLRRERRLFWRPLVATALACTSTPLYLWWVAHRAGPIGAWFTIQQAGWGTHWDWGSSCWNFLTQTLRTGDGWVPVSIAVLLLATLLAGVSVAVPAGRSPAWPPLLAYGAVIIVLTLGQSNYYHSKPRLLDPALIVLIPMAAALARARRSTLLLVLSGASLFGCWYGAYMLTIWPYAI